MGRDKSIYIPSRIPEISTHTPRVGRDGLITSPPFAMPYSFQLTRPVWGVTLYRPAVIILHVKISTHTPRVGRDHIVMYVTIMLTIFQLTRPVWGVTDNRRARG